MINLAQYLPALKELPRSLHTDIVLSLNKDVIGKVNLFNFASPDLLISIAVYNLIFTYFNRLTFQMIVIFIQK